MTVSFEMAVKGQEEHSLNYKSIKSTELSEYLADKTLVNSFTTSFQDSLTDIEFYKFTNKDEDTLVLVTTIVFDDKSIDKCRIKIGPNILDVEVVDGHVTQISPNDPLILLKYHLHTISPGKAVNITFNIYERKGDPITISKLMKYIHPSGRSEETYNVFMFCPFGIKDDSRTEEDKKFEDEGYIPSYGCPIMGYLFA